ncbi:hypothetical protein ACGFX4_17900 [Kitasatospora sp. NPDC048365]|uniref:SCO2584 family spore wall biosynthesis protein n=1 Tax=Kitasatospora sp. NPDC048365 TaxID=3364050 RepID=UPI0037174794
MAEDVGGSPYSDGADHGGADDEFATVVFDEAFVRSAAVHEPSARERQLAAAEARFEPDAGPGRGYELTISGEGLPLELRPHPEGLDDDRYFPDPWSGRDRARRRSRWGRVGFDPLAAGHGRQVAQQRWHRPVAWVLALVMGVSVVAVAVAAIYRGVGGAGEPPRRPESGTSTTGASPVPSPSVAPVPVLAAVPGS